MTDELFMVFHDSEGKHLCLLYDDETDQGFLSVSYPAHELEFPDETGNALTLSASIRDHIGYGPAVEMIMKTAVPFTHPLWSLNHSGPPKSMIN